VVGENPNEMAAGVTVVPTVIDGDCGDMENEIPFGDTALSTDIAGLTGVKAKATVDGSGEKYS